jgi:hypothetical protein
MDENTYGRLRASFSAGMTTETRGFVDTFIASSTVNVTGFQAAARN